MQQASVKQEDCGHCPLPAPFPFLSTSDHCSFWLGLTHSKATLLRPTSVAPQALFPPYR